MKLGNVGFDHLKITCLIGVNDEERIVPQDIFLDLRVQIDFSNIAKNDVLENTLCYVMLKNLCVELAVTKKYHLLETFASEIIEALLTKHHVSWAFVKIKKPSAIPEADFAIVELEGGKKCT